MAGMAREFTIEPRGAFSLAAAARFIDGWPPAAKVTEVRDEAVRLCFALDSFLGHAGVLLTQEDGSVHVEACGAGDEEELRRQVGRILSLDHDAAGLEEVLDHDPVAAALHREAGSLRPVLFHSPYEAAIWAVLSARTHPSHAQALREELSRRHGRVLEVAGVETAAAPLPQQLAELDSLPALSDEKARRLRGVAGAALEGALDPSSLREAEPAEALERLQRIRGIGPFYAGLILVRSAGVTDVLPPGGEPRLRKAVGEAYGLGGPASEDELVRIAEGWRPYRTWVALLMRAAASG